MKVSGRRNPILHTNKLFIKTLKNLTIMEPELFKQKKKKRKRKRHMLCAVCLCRPANAWVCVGSDIWMITLISSFCLGHNTH